LNTGNDDITIWHC